MNPPRTSELALVLFFLAVVGGVPLCQTCLELARHERVQATDLFRYRPTAKNLRQFEGALEEKSWFQRHLRPALQRFLFATLRDTGAKAVLGRDRWLFYRPDLRYLVEPDAPEAATGDSKWVRPTARSTHRQNVEKSILRFRDQLNERGIALVVMPVPGKPSVYPDQLSARAPAQQRQIRSPTLELLDRLQRQGVAVVDLFATFLAARESGERDSGGRLYLAHDTHWTPLGAQIAARAVAAKLGAMNLAPATKKEFRTQAVAVTRWGDILEMMQIPDLRGVFGPETAACLQVVDPALGPLVPDASARPGTYCYPGQQASVLVLGDSFCRIYQYPEPQSLGETPAVRTSIRTSARPDEGPEPGSSAADHRGLLQHHARAPAAGSGAKRLLPGSAGFISHLALALKTPVDAIVSDGGAATDARRRLSTDPEILEGKQVVVWEFAERDIASGARGWEEVALPRKLQ